MEEHPALPGAGGAQVRNSSLQAVGVTPDLRYTLGLQVRAVHVHSPIPHSHPMPPAVLTYQGSA